MLTNARTRWPAVRFRVENVAVQGALAVPQIVDALSALDRDKNVQVIVIARGGGSVEDLLPFSDETLCRAVADCRTPVLSAIGHEQDTPLLDHVADVRCSTPTDAGKRVVPDLAEESARVIQLRDRARRALHGWVDRERRLLDALRSRPVLADPLTPLEQRSAQVSALAERARRAVNEPGGHRAVGAGPHPCPLDDVGTSSHACPRVCGRAAGGPGRKPACAPLDRRGAGRDAAPGARLGRRGARDRVGDDEREWR